MNEVYIRPHAHRWRATQPWFWNEATDDGQPRMWVYCGDCGVEALVELTFQRPFLPPLLHAAENQHTGFWRGARR